VPTALSRLIADCCQPSPKARPADMREVLCRLEVAQHILEKNEATLTGPLLGDKDLKNPVKTISASRGGSSK
jgi:hypothetical protein